MPPRGEPARFVDIRRFEQLDSTNRVALELAHHGQAEDLVVVADHQTAGRGRRGRTWSAPPGSALLASVLVRPPIAPSEAHLVAMAVALAAADACTEVAEVHPALKWPNDLIAPVDAAAPGKLAGVLGESVVAGDRLVALVVGMGLNVGRAAASVRGAVALDDLAGHRVEREPLLESWLVHLARRYAAVIEPGATSRTLDAYRDRCATIGQAVRVELTDGSFEGTAVGVTDAGHLVVDTGAGARHVAAADVVHLRPLS